MMDPSNKALTDRLKQGPDYARVEGRAVSPITQQASQKMAGAHTKGQVSDAAAASTGVGTIARSGARIDADTTHWGDTAKTVDTFSRAKGLSNKLMTGAIDSMYNLADKLGDRASRQSVNTSNAYGGLAAAIGDGWGEYGSKIKSKAKGWFSTDTENGPNSTPPQDSAASNSGDNSAAYNAASESGGSFGEYSSWKDGGIIVGPGTGRSDSVPAIIDNQQPAKVSDGEYVIRAKTARHIGVDRLQKIIAMHDGMHNGQNGKTPPRIGLSAGGA